MIVERRREKNGKNSLDKKNKEETNSINASNKNFLNKHAKKWKAIIRVVIVAKGNNNGPKEGHHGNHPHRRRVLESPIVITPLWKSRLTFRPKN